MKKTLFGIREDEEEEKNCESSRLLALDENKKNYDFTSAVLDDPPSEDSQILANDVFIRATCLQSGLNSSKRANPKKITLQRVSQVGKPASSQELSLLKNYISIRYNRKIETAETLDDNYPLLDIRKAILRIHYSISELCTRLINTTMFEVLVILVILLNTVFLAMEDKNGNLPNNLNAVEDFFLYFYTIECGMKIYAYGLIYEKNSYLRDYWNILDFVIVITGWIEHQTNSGVNFSAMRTLRILRPLRSISSISGMRALFISLFKSIRPLLSALIVLFFFTFVFAIAALQLWNGILKYKCVHVDSGVYESGSEVCGSRGCGVGYECAKILDNPNFGTVNFDNIFISHIMIFQIITLEGWTDILMWTQQSFSYYSILYFIPLVFIGATLILNLTLAIITSSFFDAMKAERESQQIEKLAQMVPVFEELEKQLTSLKGTISIEAERKNSIVNLKNMNELKRQSINKFNQLFKVNINEDAAEKQNEDNNFALSSMGASLAQRSSKTYQSIIDKESGSLYHLSRLKRIKDVLMLKKEVTSVFVDKPSTSNDFKLEINEHTVLEAESAKDVIFSKKKVLERSGQSFSYSSDECGEDAKFVYEKYCDLGDEKVIKKYILNYFGCDVGFFMLVNKVQDEIVEVEYVDSIQKSIQGRFSGYDVSGKELNDVVNKLNYMNYCIWTPGLMGKYEKLKFPLKVLMKSKYMSTLMILLVLLNTACLASDHYGISSSHAYFLKTINSILTYIFTVELFFRIVGLGIYEFCRDKMNYFDSIVVVLSIVEIAVFSNSTSAISAFRAIRVFRVFRVLRVMRILRYLKSMGDIVKAVGKSVSNFFYLFLLLALFLVIFSLLGMQIFAGEFSFADGLPRGNFDSFHWAFVTTFILLSTENWNNILTSSMRSPLGPPSSLFLISWIILGNFILLNLFLAILLESFNTLFYESYINEEDDLLRELNILRIVNKKTQKKLQFLSEYEESDSDSEREVTEALDYKKVKTIWSELEENMCFKSFYLFGKENLFRVSCYKFSKLRVFEGAVLSMIVLNSLKLALDTYIIEYPQDSVESQLSKSFDYFFTAFFCCEFFIKAVALGFCYDKGTYLKDNWNKLDFLIVVFSIIDVSVSAIDLTVIKIFRLLRTLRPLRLINHNLSMKIVVIALIESLSAIFNVIAVILVTWLIYAILGVSLLSGKMYSCLNPYIETQDDCEKYGFEWKNTDMNFDDVIQGMITLFVVMSQESWPNRMYEGVDARDQGYSPVKNYNPYIAYFYIGYLIIGNFFMVNLFTAVVFNKFNEAKLNESSIATLILSKPQKLWTDIQEYIKRSKPNIEIKYAPQNKLSLICFKIMKSKIFELFIVFLILLNMIDLAMLYDEASDSYKGVLEKLNLTLTVLFIAEGVLKIIALGFKRYITNVWNRIDFAIILASIIDLSFQIFLLDSSRLLRQIPQLIRIVRVLRVSRLFRLVKSLNSLRNLIQIIGYALPAILNVLSLLTLIFFIFSILGVYLFHSVQNTGTINEYFNFSNFGNGMTILWRISTGEDYPSIMYECSNYLGSKVYLIYFIVFITLIDFVVLDLFVSVIIQNYEEFSSSSDSPVKKFREDVKIFRSIWGVYTEESNGIRISRVHIEQFLVEFCKIYQIINPAVQTQETMKKIIRNLTISIFCDTQGYFYYNDVLFVVMKKKYDKKFFRGKSEYCKKILAMEESKTVKELARIRKKAMKKMKAEPTSKLKNDSFFLNMLYMKSVFNSWRKYMIRRKNRVDSSITPQFSDVEYPGDNSKMAGNDDSLYK